MGKLNAVTTVALAGCLCLAGPAVAQVAHDATHQEHQAAGEHAEMMKGPLDIPLVRDASGTSWQPDESPMQAIHLMVGNWQVMLHGNAFLQYINERSPRTDDQFGSINWVMAMARKRVGEGDLVLRSMFSVEPLTVGACGYPDALATGESCDGQRIHDRQHPHDLFMEIAAQFRRALTGRLGYEVYGALSGEPALGPTAYPHRMSAMVNPFAPIGHHWADATHISFGVVTGGLFGRRWKAEVSAFNGREPDEDRYGFDLAALDSVSGRVSFMPTSRWALQVSSGRLREAEQEQEGGPFENVTRTTASATYHRPRAGTTWATTFVWGQNVAHDESSDAWLAETAFPMTPKDVVFGRFESVQKNAVDLVLPVADPTTVFRVAKLSLGYSRNLVRYGGLDWGAGGSVSSAVVPEELSAAYDIRRSLGFAVFVSVRPTAMSMNAQP